MTFLDSLRASTRELTGYFVFLLVTGTLGPFLFGYHLAELNAPQDVITCVRRSIGATKSGLPQCMPMNSLQIGLVASGFTVGGFFGALAAGPLSARYGRLRPIRLTTIFATLGPIAEALAPNIAVMVGGRFVSGLGAGAALVVVPIYVSEIAPPAQKGFFGAFTQIMTNVGILSAQVLGYFLSHDSMWRLILAIGGAVGLLQACGLLFAVDSPKWQADNGQPRAARANLRKIRGRDVDLAEETKGWDFDSSGEANSDEQETLLGDRDHAVNQSGSANRSVGNKNVTLGTFEVFRHPHYRPATFLVMFILAAQQFCGINSIVMYGVSLLSDLLKANSALLNIFVALLNVVVTTACAPLIDILGRKTCLLSSMAGMGISSVLLGIGIRGSIPMLSTVAVLLFVGSFGLGLGPVPFMLSSELVGQEAVGAAQSWGLASNWFATFIVAQFFPLVNERLGKGIIYFVFAALDALFFALTVLLIPETKGKKNADEVWGREPRRED